MALICFPVLDGGSSVAGLGQSALLLARCSGAERRPASQTLPDFGGQMVSRYFSTEIGLWKSMSVRPISECSISTGPKQMATFCGVILLHSDWEATSRRWSIRNRSVHWRNISGQLVMWWQVLSKTVSLVGSGARDFPLLTRYRMVLYLAIPRWR